MKREEFISWAESRGWKMDRFGHLQRSRKEPSDEVPSITVEVKYRYKLSRIAVRYEVKSGGSWYRLRSGYFPKLSITTDGKLAGLTR